MNDDDILTAIARAIRSETGDEAAVIEGSTRASDVAGWDSLAHGRIMMTIEVELSISIDIDRTYRARDVGDLLAIVRELLAGRS